MFKDLVSGQSCGVANPLANLGQSQQQLGLNVQEAKNYSGLQPQAHFGGISVVPQQQNQSGIVRPDASTEQFIQQFNNGGGMMQHQPMMMPPNPQMLRAMSNPSADLMAQEFHQSMQQQPPQQQPSLVKMSSQSSEPSFSRQPSLETDLNLAWSSMQSPTAQQQQHHHHHHQQMLSRQNSQNAQHMQHMQMYNMMIAQQQQQRQQQMPMMQQQQHQSIVQQPVSFSSQPKLSPFREAIVKAQQEAQQQQQQQAKDGDAEIQDPLNAFVTEEPQPQYTSALNPQMMEQLRNSDSKKWKESKFMQFVDKVNSGEIRVDGATNSMTVVPESERVALNQGNSWADEFQPDPTLEEVLSGRHGDQDLWGESFSEMQSMFEGMHMNGPQQQQEPEQPLQQQEYKFVSNEQTNKFHKTSDAYEKGVQFLKLGKLRDAILALEAAVMENDGNADAWARLGQARAENEEEPEAIAALTKAIDLDPYHLQALLMLGVSHTNDLEEGKALTYLRTWLLHHPEYQSASMNEEQAIMLEYEEMYGVEAMKRGDHDQVTRMFLNAVKVNPLDPELHEVLGVLYHISHDYAKAIESFKNALQLEPSNAQLWNKLGATQANSNNSKEALLSYRRALQLRPTYVRALANTAIAFANQGQHREACRTYIATLKQNPSAEHIWSYLRISLSLWGRDDLVQLTASRDVSLFKNEFA